MNIYTDLVGLLLAEAGGGYLLIPYYPGFFSLFFPFYFFHYTEYLILVWESVNDSILVLKYFRKIVNWNIILYKWLFLVNGSHVLLEIHETIKFG